eukprot:TRINITY_DN9181_c1_g1_i1.p1 TRINITY_DN9181_c1_g1~~TRINITY_DN9181_c1_g1_i1.p1  ORF type:complete len:463 (-),score=66.50 TRINITY_DN9181_c1_g1_i1:20-1408(-)
MRFTNVVSLLSLRLSCPLSRVFRVAMLVGFSCFCVNSATAVELSRENSIGAAEHMTCLSNAVPCKYFAAGGCGKAGSCCWEKVGSGDDWVEKTHGPEDGARIEAAWLSQSLSGAASLAAAQRGSDRIRSGSSSTCISEWREGYDSFAAAGDILAMASLGQEIQTALDDVGKLTGRDREAAKKLQKKASKAALGDGQQLREKSEQASRTAAEASRTAALAAIDAEAKKQTYAWAVVVDLEGKPPNICEFPAIVLDTSSGREVGRFHRWVRSEATERGVTRNKSSNAVTFPTAFSEFRKKLSELGVNEDQAILVSCGDFDANSLYAMHTHYDLTVPEFLGRWVNLKDAVLKFEYDRLPSVEVGELAMKIDGMNRLADYLQIPGIHESVGLELHHLGMYDTTKIAMILVHLILCQGYVVRETATRNIMTGKWKALKGPTVREFSVRTMKGPTIRKFSDRTRNVSD